ncbi:MAG: 3-deoxy-7-phosphoheptulonate synthase [Myxococcales bacterium]|nr:3-deoxy-7-phosphoheptulonate synthase [Myxococcales bacterium]
MLVVMTHGASPENIADVCTAIAQLGFEARPMPGEQRTAIGVVGNDRRVDDSHIRGLPGVSQVIHVSAPYKQVSREWKAESTVIELSNGTRIGGNEVVVMAGPCAVESEEKLMEVAKVVAESGATILRGGAYKPRTSPYSFQGMGVEGLKILAKARDAYGLAVITEAIDPASADAVGEYADIIQIGARNMQNFALLKHVGQLGKPVMLKRGMSATIKEWLLAAEYILNAGNEQVILCERGIRSFDSATRNVMDITAVALARTLTHLPIIADPAHATGRRDMVAPVARASVAVGADGIMVETHPRPNEALSDGPQSLYPEQLQTLMVQLSQISSALGRPLATLT